MKSANLGKIVSLLLALFLVACNEDYKGEVQVLEDLNLRSGRKTKSLPAGQYKVSAGLKSPNKIGMTIVREGKSNDIKLEFKIPEGQSVDPNMGYFHFPANEIAQDYDLNGRLTSRTTETAEVSELQPCVYNTYVFPVCEWDYYRNRRHCWYQRHNEYGLQEVRYYEVVSDYRLVFGFIKPNGVVVASGNGGYRNSKRHYTYQGFCQHR